MALDVLLAMKVTPTAIFKGGTPAIALFWDPDPLSGVNRGRRTCRDAKAGNLGQHRA